MRELSEPQLQAFIDGLLTGGNDNPYNTPAISTKPCCLYFYYVTFTAGGVPTAKVYFYNNGDTVMTPAFAETIITRLTANARLDDDNPPKCASRFDEIRWRRKSFLAFVVDDPGWTFAAQGLVFNEANGKTPNHSFFHGKNIPVPVKNADGSVGLLSGMYCINHMTKDVTGTPLESTDSEEYVYYLIHHAAKILVADIDPGGTNQGPPEKP